MSNYKENTNQRVYNLKYGFTFRIQSHCFCFKDYYNALKECADNKSYECPNKQLKYVKKIMCGCEDKTKCDCLNYCFFENELINRIGDISEIRKVCRFRYYKKKHFNT